MQDNPSVTHCICTDQEISRIVEKAALENLTLLEVSEKTNCGTICGMCLPYIDLRIQEMKHVPDLCDHEPRHAASD
jgi:bacterioferritin-associated ferredoxin